MPRRQPLGQHFLTDARVIDQIIDHIAAEDSDSIIEIGPGKGALTEKLFDLARDFKAVELDQKLVAYLKAGLPDVQVIHADVLKVDAGLFIGRRVVGNLPYEISTPLLMRLIAIPGIVDMVFMLQLEVANRLVAKPGSSDWSRLSCMIQYHCETALLFSVDAGSFAPPPQVQSAVVQLKPRKSQLSLRDPDAYAETVRMAFTQRRKTLRNSLKQLAIDWSTTPIDSSQRADQTNIADFVAIANRISN